MTNTLGTAMGSGPAEGRNGSYFGITYNPQKNDKITDFTSPGTFNPDPANTPGAAEVFVFGGGGSGNSGIAGVCYGGGGGAGSATDGGSGLPISTTFGSPQPVTVGGGGSTSSIGPISEGGGNSGSSCSGGNNADYNGGSGPGPGFAGGGGAGSTHNGYPGNDPDPVKGRGGDGTDCTPFGIESSPGNFIFAGGGGSMRGPLNAGTGNNTGSGGNGGGEAGGNSGWPGRVMVKEAGYGPLENTSGVWPLQAQYFYKGQGNWTS